MITYHSFRLVVLPYKCYFCNSNRESLLCNGFYSYTIHHFLSIRKFSVILKLGIGSFFSVFENGFMHNFQEHFACTLNSLINILLPKLFRQWEKLFYWPRKTFEIQGWKPRICKIFEITRTIYSNSERSQQFLVTECFFNLFLEVSQI